VGERERDDKEREVGQRRNVYERGRERGIREGEIGEVEKKGRK
jgi:hypothetical protein